MSAADDRWPTLSEAAVAVAGVIVGLDGAGLTAERLRAGSWLLALLDAGRLRADRRELLDGGVAGVSAQAARQRGDAMICSRCACHNGGSASSIPCSVPGGCGTIGCGRGADWLPARTAYPCPLCGNDLNTAPVVCAGCAERGRRDLADLPRLATLLLQLARDTRRDASEPISGSRERPLPLRTSLWSFIGLAPPGAVSTADPGDALCQVGDVPLADTLATTCRAVADDLRGTAPRVRRHGDPDEAVARFASYLSAQHDRTCRLTWADEYLTELHDLWRRARTLAEDWPLVHKLPAPCPHCGTLTLRRDNGASFVFCDARHGGCGRNWDEREYERLVLILVTEAREQGWASTTKVTT